MFSPKCPKHLIKLLSFYQHNRVSCLQILDYAASIKAQKKPAVFSFATTDKLLETDIPTGILSHVGIEDRHITKLCRENNVKDSIDVDSSPGCMGMF